MRARLMHANARDGEYTFRYISMDGSTISITLDSAELRQLHSATTLLMLQEERPKTDRDAVHGAA